MVLNGLGPFGKKFGFFGDKGIFEIGLENALF
jgi:hypothetical protein